MSMISLLKKDIDIGRSVFIIEDFKTKRPRLLTPVECERINGFPDDWTNTGMSDKKRYFCITI